MTARTPDSRFRGNDDGAARRPRAAGGTAALELARIGELASALGVPGVVADAAQVRARLEDRHFHVACVGQFKRGKSTLINALVGEPVLPVGVPPVTSVVTILRHGTPARAVVHFADGTSQDIERDAIAAYVSEAHNPQNARAVAAVDLWLPSPLLAGGLCLVDTPGVGSVLAGNTDVTRRFVPHIDAALVVLGADPPIAGEELALVEQIAADVPHLIFVQNKADRTSDADRAQAAAFTGRVLAERLGRPAVRLIDISARDRLQGGAGFEWTALEQALRGLTEASSGVLESLRRRACRRLTGRLLAAVAEHEDALRRPVDESQRRLERLRQGLDETDRAIRDLGQLLAVQQHELGRAFERQRATFVAEAAPAARRQLAAALRAAHGHGSRRRARAMETAADTARGLVFDWLDRIEPDASRLYAEAMHRFVRLAADLESRLLEHRGADAASFDVDTTFRIRRRFYFTEILSLTSPGPLTWFLDVALPGAWRQRAVSRDADRYLMRLVETNSRRVAADLEERVLGSRRQLESELRRRLSEAVAVAEAAAAAARDHVAGGTAAVEQEMNRLDAIRTECEAIRAIDDGEPLSH